MWRAAAVVACMLALACSDLPPIGAGICGNGAVETGEDCDGSSADGTCGSAAAGSNACRFVCSDGAVCPSGDGCGVDERCRAPSGRFVVAPGPYAFQATTFRIGDVDGDRFGDLIGIRGTRLQVRRGNAEGDLHDLTTQPVPRPGNGVVIADLDGDTHEDVVLSTPAGIVTFLGSPEGLDPHPYSPIDLSALQGAFRTHQVHPPGSAQLDLLFAADGIATAGSATLADALVFADGVAPVCFDGTPASGNGCGSAFGVPASVARLIGGDLAVGRTGLACAPATTCSFKGSADTSDEVAIAVSGATRLALVTAVSAGSGIAELEHVEDVALPNVGSGSTTVATVVAADGSVGFADFDGDHCSDLAVATTPGTFSIAYNTCDGKLADAVAVTASDIVALPKATGPGNVPFGVPRLFTDVDGDGRMDVVTDHLVAFGTCARPTCVRWQGAGKVAIARAWTTVLAIDVNDDGRVDLVGATRDQPNVEVYLNAGDQQMNDFTLLTDDPVRLLAAGDFDGDLLPDFAFVTSPTTGGDEDDTLFISYGVAGGGPGDPILIGRFGAIDALAPVALPTVSFGKITNLLVASDRAGVRSAALLLGDPSRQVIAPFALTSVNQVAEIAVSMLFGRFVGSDGRDLVEIDENGGGDNDIVLLAGTGGGDLALVGRDVSAGSDVLAHALAAPTKTSPATVWSHGVLAAGVPETIVGVRTDDTAGGCTTSLYAVTPMETTGAWPATETALALRASGGTCVPAHSVLLRDLDRDGADDALLQFCGSSCATGTNALIPASGGGFAFDRAAIVDTPGFACSRLLAIDVAPAQVELIATCSSTAAPTSGTDVPPFDLLTFARADDGTWQAVAQVGPVASDGRFSLGDVNGDGLEDLAVTSGSDGAATVQIFLQCALGDACGSAAAP